jgi:hypothetical protein
MLSTDSGDGPIDVARLIERLARREHFRDLPREPLLTLRRGVQLLVDTAEAMLPFARDQQVLERALHDVVGDSLEVLRFVGCPSRGAGRGRPSRWPREYPPPPAGTVVLVVTDLGIGGSHLSTEPASTSEWAVFAESVQHADCPLVALVPYAPARWPECLQRLVRMVYWDRPTTAGAVRHAIGMARRQGR